MFNEKFKKNHQFETNFFEAAINSASSSRLSHAFLLSGSDSVAQYYLAIQVARFLNCEKDNLDDCECVNCSWISQNRHPAVITISPIDYTYGNKDGKSSNVISVGQARYLKKELANSSQYHRIIIFTDAVEGNEYERKFKLHYKNYEELSSPPGDNSEKESGFLCL